MAAAPPRVTGHVFRPRSALAAGLSWALITLAWAWSAVHDGGAPALARQLPMMVATATLVYAVLVRPSVEVSATGVTLRNVITDVEVPWPALAEVGTRYALTLVSVDGRRFTAWAAPASGRHTDARLTAGEVRALAWGDDADLPPSSASTASHSGAVAAWVRRDWRRAVQDAPVDGVHPPADDAGVRTRSARGVLAVGGVAAVLAVLTAIVPGR